MKGIYDNKISKWKSNHGTLKFNPDHRNAVLFLTWEVSKFILVHQHGCI